jgi:RNA polymerase sigma-70 factor, ECF subfamily
MFVFLDMEVSTNSRAAQVYVPPPPLVNCLCHNSFHSGVFPFERQGKTMLEGVIEPVSKLSPAMPNSLPASTRLSPEDFEQIFLSTYPRLVAILRRMLGDSGRAEEIANEAFLKLHSTVLPPAIRSNVPGWLYRTAMNLGIDELRARNRHTPLAREASDAVSASSRPEDGLQRILRSERQQRVRLALSKLKPEWSQILFLRASGYSYKEIAAHLEIPAASVGTMLIRAEAGFEKCYLELFGAKELEVV